MSRLSREVKQRLVTNHNNLTFPSAYVTRPWQIECGHIGSQSAPITVIPLSPYTQSAATIHVSTSVLSKLIFSASIRLLRSLQTAPRWRPLASGWNYPRVSGPSCHSLLRWPRHCGGRNIFIPVRRTNNQRLIGTRNIIRMSTVAATFFYLWSCVTSSLLKTSCYKTVSLW